MFETSPLFSAMRECEAKIIVSQGGTSSGKTYAIMQLLSCIAIETSNLIITVVGQDVPNLKAGPIRDITRIIRASPILKTFIDRYNKSDRELWFTNGSMIEFKSYEDEQDAHSGKRDYLFINEANGIYYNIFKQLQLRTNKQTFLDYNPSSEFWVHQFVLNNKDLYPSVQLYISDHRHNPFISEDLHQAIERLKYEDEELYKVYARGLTGKIEGLVLRNWFVCENIPKDAKLIAYGLDFGFTNDETGLLEVFMQDGELWLNELIYKTGLTNQDISNEMKVLGVLKSKEIIADSAEPKSIEEIKRQGWYILPAQKGPDSIKASIDILKRYKINVTKNSTNLRKELSKYVWKKDREGKTLNVPIDSFNHLIDPLRYVALSKLKISYTQSGKSWMPPSIIPSFESEYDKVK